MRARTGCCLTVNPKTSRLLATATWCSSRSASSSEVAPVRAVGRAPRATGPFLNIFGFAESQIDVSPLKRPWLEGSLTVNLSDDISITFAGNVEGVDSEAVSEGVRTKALLFAECIRRTNGGSPAHPLQFLRQNMLLRHSAVLDQARSLDLGLRFCFDARGDAGEAVDLTCTIHAVDTWSAAPREACLVSECGPGDAVLDILARAVDALGGQVQVRRDRWIEQSLAEAEARLAELAAVTTRSTVVHGLPCRVPPLPCRLELLSHTETRQPLVLRCLSAGPDPAEWSVPLVAVQGPDGLVYASHSALTMVGLDALQELCSNGMLTAGDIPGAPFNIVGTGMQLALAADRALASAAVLSAAGPLRCAPPPSAYTLISGRAAVNEWTHHSNDAHGRRGLPALPLDAQGRWTAGTEATTPLTSQFVAAVAYEVGWGNAPVVRMPPSVAPRSDESSQLSLRFPSVLATTGDASVSEAVYTLGRRYRNVMEAVVDLNGVAPAWVGEAASASEPNESTSSPAPARAPTHSHADELTVQVQLLDVAQSLRNHGVVRCTLDCANGRLNCLDEAGTCILHFGQMWRLEGIGRLLRFVSRDKQRAVYSPVTINPSTKLQTLLSHLLRGLFVNKPNTKRRNTAPYMKKILIPMPLVENNGFTYLGFDTLVEQAELVRQIVSLARHCSADPSAWPLAEVPQALFFSLWPLTRGTLAGMAETLPAFAYTLKPAVKPVKNSPGSGRNGPRVAEVRDGLELCLSFDGPQSPSGVSKRREARAHLRAGPHLLEDFHRALSTFAETGGATAELVEGSGAAEPPLPERGFASVSTGAWESLAHYAVPSRITAAHRRLASKVVVDNLLKNNVIYREDLAAGEHTLVLVVAANWGVSLAQLSTDEAATSPSSSWKVRLCSAFIDSTDATRTLAPAVAVIQEVGSHLDALELLASGVSDANQYSGILPRRLAYLCHLVDSPGDSRMVAEVHARAASDHGQQQLCSGTALLSSSGANRLEALMALLPKLHRLIEMQAALAPLAPCRISQRGFNTVTDSSSASSSLRARASVLTYDALGAVIADRRRLHRVGHAYWEASKTLSIVGFADDARAGQLLAALQCPWESIPRYLTHLYIRALAVPGSEAAVVTPAKLVADSAAQLEQIRRSLTSRAPSQIMEIIAWRLPLVIPQDTMVRVHRATVTTASGATARRSSADVPWVATLELTPEALQLPHPAGDQHSNTFIITASAATKREAVRECIDALYCWIVEGIPIPPHVGAMPAPQTRAPSQIHVPRILSSPGGQPPPCDLKRRRDAVAESLPPPRPADARGPRRVGRIQARAKRAALSADGPSGGGGGAIPLSAAPAAAALAVAAASGGVRRVGRPGRKPERAVLRPDLQPSEPRKTAASAAMKEGPLSAFLASAAAKALQEATGLSGVVRVRLSRIFGIQVQFLVLPGGSADTKGSTATVLAEAWEAAGDAWAPLQVLRAVYAVAERAGNGGTSDAALAKFRTRAAPRTIGSALSDESVCAYVFSHYCGLGAAVAPGPGLTHFRRVDAGRGPLPLLHPVRLELAVARKGIPGSGQDACRGRISVDLAAVAAPFGATYTATLRMVQEEEAGPASRRVIFSRTLAHIEGTAEQATREALWATCAADMLSTLGLGNHPRATLTPDVLGTAIVSWLSQD